MHATVPIYGLYAYGLIGTRLELHDLWGIDKTRAVYAVERRGLYVVVSEIEIDTFQSQIQILIKAAKNTESTQNQPQALLQAHEDVIDALMGNTTVVPFRFGTILKDEQSAMKMLEDQEEKFKNLLARFAGRVEWGLKVYVDEQEYNKHIQATPQHKHLEEQRAKLSKGVAYLLAKKLEADLKENTATQLTRITEHIFQELGKDAYEAKLDKTLPRTLTHKKKEMLLNSVYLIEKTHIDTFWKTEKSLIEQYEPLGLELEVSGPWPPYSFVD